MHLKSSLAQNDFVLTHEAINLTINDPLIAHQCLLHLR